MSQLHLKPTGARHNAAPAGITGGLTYAEVMRDPRLMERLLRDARRARSEAIYRMLAAAARALSVMPARIAQFGYSSVLDIGRRVYSTLFHADRAARR